MARCEYCKWKSGEVLHQPGCPGEKYENAQQKIDAIQAWHRGWSDGLNGVGHAKDGNNSYLLGYSRGDTRRRMIESNFDSNADFDKETLNDLFADL